MKKYIPAFYLLLIVVMISCEKGSYINYGFDSPVNKNSRGLLIADIPGTSERILLNGTIRLSEGELEIILVNSCGVTVYSKIISAPVELQINETFEARMGYWKFKYTSRDGVGEIDLHIYK